MTSARALEAALWIACSCRVVSYRALFSLRNMGTDAAALALCDAMEEERRSALFRCVGVPATLSVQCMF